LANNYNRAARGERRLSSLQSGDAGHGGKMSERSADTRASDDAAASWDPYQVWLTRVKQPREQSERTQSRSVAVESAKASSRNETTTLRSLLHALHR